MNIRCKDPSLAAALDRGEPGSIFVVDPDIADNWDDIRDELAQAFSMTKAAAIRGESIVYVVRSDDLLGRDTIGAAIVATALLSAARTASLELKEGTVNTLAIERDSTLDAISTWVRHLLAGGPRGELVRLGGSHLGKALP